MAIGARRNRRPCSKRPPRPKSRFHRRNFRLCNSAALKEGGELLEATNAINRVVIKRVGTNRMDKLLKIAGD